MRRKPALLRRVHYWLGLGLALPLILLALTGILLNHSDGLKLAHRFVNSNLLMQWYGVQPVAPELGYKLGESWLSYARNSLWLDDTQIDSDQAKPRGALLVDGLIVIAQPLTLGLYTAQGQRVERVPVPQQLTPVTGLSTQGNHILLRTPGGVYKTDTNFTQWNAVDAVWAQPSQQEPLPPTLRQSIGRALARSTISWEKVILDLHNGNLFGRWGALFLDLFAVITVALATTGCFLWLRNRRRQR